MSAEPPAGPQAEPVAISWEDLPARTLRNVLEDLVSRGEPDEVSMDTRCQQLLAALKEGKTRLFFDPIEETVFLHPR